MQLVKVTRSPAKGKKWRAHFKDDGRETHTDFGATGYEDYTMHGDKERRANYISRHARDLRTDDPTRAGYLSMFLLWNKPTLQGSIADYRARLRKYNETGHFPRKI